MVVKLIHVDLNYTQFHAVGSTISKENVVKCRWQNFSQGTFESLYFVVSPVSVQPYQRRAAKGIAASPSVNY